MKKGAKCIDEQSKQKGQTHPDGAGYELSASPSAGDSVGDKCSAGRRSDCQRGVQTVQTVQTVQPTQRHVSVPDSRDTLFVHPHHEL